MQTALRQLPVDADAFLPFVPSPRLADIPAAVSKAPLGTYRAVGPDWRLKVVSSKRNANTDIAHENMFNDAPAPGYRYVLVQVRGTNVGVGDGDAFMDLDYKLLGRRTQELYRSGAALAPTDLTTRGPVARGGRFTGNLCFLVRDIDVAARNLLLRVHSTSDFSDANHSWFCIT